MFDYKDLRIAIECAKAWGDDIIKDGAIIKIKRYLRKQAKEAAPAVNIIYGDSGESWDEFYTVEFDGKKAELLEYLDEKATRIYSDYDCTGKPFTTGFKAAHICGNLWRVRESFSIDV